MEADADVGDKIQTTAATAILLSPLLEANVDSDAEVQTGADAGVSADAVSHADEDAYADSDPDVNADSEAEARSYKQKEIEGGRRADENHADGDIDENHAGENHADEDCSLFRCRHR